jgi:hypothetical protein
MYEKLLEKIYDLIPERREASQYYTARVLQESADAIEELQKDLERSKEYEAFWEKEANEALRRFQVAIASKPRWIPVTERLPKGADTSGEICENVNLLLDDGLVTCGWMNGITGKAYYLNARDDYIQKAPISRVSHWMPLPAEPKEETE